MKDRLGRYIAGSALIIFISALLSFLFMAADNPTIIAEGETFRVMFYNVENLFDTLDCSLNDDEFLPDSDRKWNRFKYYRKLDNIAKVIVSVGGWNPPTIVGLCEIENTNVLSDLVRSPLLRNSDYNYIYANNADERGIGVAILFQQSFSLISSELLYPLDEYGDTLTTRTVLFARLANDYDTLGIIVTHWPSRRGGASASESDRVAVAETIRERLSIKSEPGEERLKILLMGDLNCEPGSRPVKDIILTPIDSCGYDKRKFTNISVGHRSGNKGTYKYQGNWVLYDQILVNENLLNCKTGLKYLDDSFSIIENSFLLMDDNSYRGLKPFSTWSGPRYLGGFSDHLPVSADLVLQQ